MDFLRYEFIKLLEDIPLAERTIIVIHYQIDGAPAHLANELRMFLDEKLTG